MTEPNWDIPCPSDLWFPSFSYQLSTPNPEKCDVLGPLGLMSQSMVQVDQSGTTTLHDCTATIYFFWGISFSVFLYGTQQGSLIASKKKIPNRISLSITRMKWGSDPCNYCYCSVKANHLLYRLAPEKNSGIPKWVTIREQKTYY